GDHDDRDGLRRILRGLGGWSRRSRYNIRAKAHAFGSKSRIAFGLTIGGQIVDDYCLPLDIPQIAPPLQEGVKSCRLQRSGIERKETEPRKFWLLRARSSRPRHSGSAKHGDKIAPSHVPSSRGSGPRPVWPRI